MANQTCKKCGQPFTSSRGAQKFCSLKCRGYTTRSTREQYEKIDGNIDLYLNRLLYKHNNIPAKDRSNLNLEMLKGFYHAQDGKCAMSGIEMTYNVKQGETYPFNISIDCTLPISRGGKYEGSNIQLVCSILNSLMKYHSKDLVVQVCKGVAAMAPQK